MLRLVCLLLGRLLLFLVCIVCIVFLLAMLVGIVIVSVFPLITLLTVNATLSDTLLTVILLNALPAWISLLNVTVITLFVGTFVAPSTGSTLLTTGDTGGVIVVKYDVNAAVSVFAVRSVIAVFGMYSLYCVPAMPCWLVLLL